MNNIIHLSQTQLTMTSREIAEFSDKQHSNVCRDIRNILEQVKEAPFKYESGYIDANGQWRSRSARGQMTSGNRNKTGNTSKL